jgi:DNA gyrase inhibitor GyrI
VSEPDLSLIDVPGSKAAHAKLLGDYAGLKDIHQSLMEYMTARGLTPTLTVEQYTVGPPEEADPAQWVTDTYYLHE